MILSFYRLDNNDKIKEAIADKIGIINPYLFWAIIVLRKLYLLAFLHKCLIVRLFGNILLTITIFVNITLYMVL